jgi:hypothetical protein
MTGISTETFFIGPNIGHIFSFVQQTQQCFTDYKASNSWHFFYTFGDMQPYSKKNEVCDFR